MTAPAAAPAIVRCGRVASTQAVVFALAADGAPDRTVVVADSQSAGRGRRGRAWHDEPGASLLVSILLRPQLPVSRLPALSLTAGVAVAEALMHAAGLPARLKWPNDVLVNGRKLAGILLEARFSGEIGRAGATSSSNSPPTFPPDHAPPAPTIALGIGVNVAQRAFPPELAGRATSVRLAGGAVDREALLTGLLDALDRWRGRLEREGFAPVRERWRALADTLGRTVTVEGVTGVAVDVDDDGALLLEVDGHRRRVVGGELG
ncbi:MAG TPA: biotin--[acetyl-CoA-carboxylase] ligase [Candidatus Binatia bacterium]|nr:biotin--[acetyl-CoA-carboxylase] ligase [Candidatus Binatia bacterium]